MGANSFYVTEMGKTPGEAFDRAVEQSQYEDGHAYDQGGIGGKAGHGLVSLDQILKPFSAKRRAEIVASFEAVHEHDPMYDGSRKRSSYAVWRQVNGTWYSVPKGIKPNETAALVKINETVGDKWGPTGVYEVTGQLATTYKQREGRYRQTRGMKVYVFVGVAPS